MQILSVGAAANGNQGVITLKFPSFTLLGRRGDVDAGEEAELLADVVRRAARGADPFAAVVVLRGLMFADRVNRRRKTCELVVALGIGQRERDDQGQ